MIVFKDVSYYYPDAGKPAISHADMSIDEGRITLLVGESGSGKTTFLRCINGLIPHFHGGRFLGDVLVNGMNTKEHPVADLSRTVGFVFQDTSGQALTQKVEDELAFGLENLGLEQTLIGERIDDVLDQLGLGSLRHRDINRLSGGERQKVAIGCALAMQPKILVLDEPTAELDPDSAEDVLTLLQKINQELGLSVVISEHRLERVIQYADQIVYVHKNKIKQGPTGEMLEIIEQVPPIVEAGRYLGWDPLPRTIAEGKRSAQNMSVSKNISNNDHKRDEEPAGDIAIEASGIHFAYNGKQALSGVDLTVRSGQILALMGRNGTGKTTFLRSLCGFLKPSEGTFSSDRSGQDKSEIGYIPQRPSSLLFSETVSEELGISLRLKGLKEDGVADLLALLQLSKYTDSYPRDLSLGEQQRVAIGAVLAAQPGVLILDEPTHGLDYRAKEILVGILKRCAEDGKAIIMATHDVELVARCADRVAVMDDGRIIVDGPARDVLSESTLFSPQLNRIFGGQVMVVEDIVSYKDNVNADEIEGR